MKQDLIITNVSALVNTGVEFDLFMISQRVANCTYNVRRLPAVVIRKIKPKCTLLLFKSGKIMALGTQSQKDAQISMRKICKQLQKVCFIKMKRFDFKITNVFGSAQFDFQINLPKLCDIGGGIKLQTFPGVFCHMKEHIKAATVYYSGKLTLIGGKSRQDLEKALIYLRKKLIVFRKEKPAPVTPYDSGQQLPKPMGEKRDAKVRPTIQFPQDQQQTTQFLQESPNQLNEP